MAALGCVLVVLGEAIRKAAVVGNSCGLHLYRLIHLKVCSLRLPLLQVTAGKSFSHTLSPVKRNSQKLVTHGIYRCCLL